MTYSYRRFLQRRRRVTLKYLRVDAPAFVVTRPGACPRYTVIFRENKESHSPCMPMKGVSTFVVNLQTMHGVHLEATMARLDHLCPHSSAEIASRSRLRNKGNYSSYIGSCRAQLDLELRETVLESHDVITRNADHR